MARNSSGCSGKWGENILFFTVVTLFGLASIETKKKAKEEISVYIFFSFLKTFWFNQWQNG